MRSLTILISLMCSALFAQAQTQTYYVPFPDDDVFTMLSTALPVPGSRTYSNQVSVISVEYQQPCPSDHRNLGRRQYRQWLRLGLCLRHRSG